MIDELLVKQLAIVLDTEMMVSYHNPKLSLEQAKQLARIRLKRIGPYPLEQAAAIGNAKLEKRWRDSHQ